MKLKPNINVVDFLKATMHCPGEVWYTTSEGDVLNLKSQLSQYIMLAALTAKKSVALPAGEIICKSEFDYQALAAYLEK